MCEKRWSDSFPLINFFLVISTVFLHMFVTYFLISLVRFCSHPFLTLPSQSGNILSFPFLSFPFLSYPILSYPILSYRIVSYRIVSYRIIYHIVSDHILSYRIISYRIIYHIISYRIVSYRILSYLILFSSPPLFPSLIPYPPIMITLFCLIFY